MFEGSKIKSGVLFVILTILLTGIEVGSVYGIRVSKKIIIISFNFLNLIYLIFYYYV